MAWYGLISLGVVALSTDGAKNSPNDQKHGRQAPDIGKRINILWVWFYCYHCCFDDYLIKDVKHVTYLVGISKTGSFWRSPRCHSSLRPKSVHRPQATCMNIKFMWIKLWNGVTQTYWDHLSQVSLCRSVSILPYDYTLWKDNRKGLKIIHTQVFSQHSFVGS